MLSVSLSAGTIMVEQFRSQVTSSEGLMVVGE